MVSALVTHGFPLLGAIICNVLWFTPLPVILEARYTRYLGPINPYPLVMIAMNSIGWTLYGCVRDDIYLFCASFIGVIMGIYYIIVCLTVIAKKSADADFSQQYLGVEYCFLGGLLFWCLVGFVAGILCRTSSDPYEEAKSVIGVVCCVFTVLYYASPLSTLYEVLSERDSSSLYLPLITVNMINTMMWLGYGTFAIKDMNVMIPNGLGLLLSFLQIFLRLTIPVKETGQTQSFEHVLDLIKGNIPPTFVTSEKGRESYKEEQRRNWEARKQDQDQIVYGVFAGLSPTKRSSSRKSYRDVENPKMEEIYSPNEDEKIPIYHQ